MNKASKSCFHFRFSITRVRFSATYVKWPEPNHIFHVGQGPRSGVSWKFHHKCVYFSSYLWRGAQIWPSDEFLETLVLICSVVTWQKLALRFLKMPSALGILCPKATGDEHDFSCNFSSCYDVQLWHSI